MNPTLVPLLLVAAVRALLVALTVWAGLRILRVGNVLAQKAVWGLVLAAALIMPLIPQLPGWRWLPAPAAFRLPQNPFAHLRPLAQATPATASNIASNLPAKAQSAPAAADRDSAPTYAEFNPPDTSETALYSAMPIPIPQAPAPHKSSSPVRLAMVAVLLYLAVCAALLLRLIAGLVTAMNLWRSAQPASARLNPRLTAGIAVRSSRRVASPVTIGLGVLLPADYAEWDAEKLRIVLAHERSHIRQGDFYLQLLAGIYASLFWFSPLGWWLKRKLCELSEAISDRAGLEAAASRSSYAQLLLEFAALPRPTLTGVAMARTSHLSQRIERLLNESSFRQAFAAAGRRALLAVLLVPAALFAVTALIRVEAAAAPASQAAPQAPITGQSAPEQVTNQGVQSSTSAPSPIPTPSAAPAPNPAPEPVSSASRTIVILPTPGPSTPPIVPPAPPTPPDILVLPHSAKGTAAGKDHFNMAIVRGQDEEPLSSGFVVKLPNMYFYGDGDPYAVAGDPGTHVRFSGKWNGNRLADVEKARQIAHGHFLMFQHQGKTYVIDDPAIVAQVEAMNKPLDDLSSQMRALSNQQKGFGQQQRDAARQMRQAAVQAPDLSEEIAALNAAAASLQAKQGATLSQKDLEDLQKQVAQVEGKLGALQGKIVMQQFNADGGLAKLSEQQGQFGSEMGKLGTQMGQIAIENESKIKGIIDQSLSNGEAHPVE